MRCFVCRNPARPHIIRALKTAREGRGWARICVPCAIAYDLEGSLLAGPDDRELAERWFAYLRRNEPIDDESELMDDENELADDEL